MLEDETRAAPRTTRRAMLLLWLLALLAALVFDGAIARALEPVAGVVKRSEVAEELKEGGQFVFVLILAAFVWILHPASWRGAATLCLSAITAGLVYIVVRWPVGRIRPIKGIDPYHLAPFRNGLDGFLNMSNASFPSGHTCVAFATAACMSWLLPRGRWAFYACASLLAAERVAELAHYLSDVVGSAALGMLAFHIARFAMQALLKTQSGACERRPLAERTHETLPRRAVVQHAQST